MTNKNWLLLASVFLVSTCGLVYELVAGTLSSYLLGDSITQFSLVIGFFLSSMGLGSFLSKYVDCELLKNFVYIQIWTGLIGGLSGLILFSAFTFTESYTPILLCLVAVLGTLVGFEIPLLIRICKENQSLKITLSNVLTFDYIGALIASILFPIFLLPHLGLVRTPLLFGLINLAVGTILILAFHLSENRFLKGLTISTISILVFTFAYAGKITGNLENRLYDDDIVFTKTTPYQRIVLTRWKTDVRLFINGALQFSSLDEYRYHESLVHPAMAMASHPKNILVMGGGDGLAVREILKYPSVEKVDLVDIDPDITNLFRSRPLLAELNQNSLNDKRVNIINVDAMNFIRDSESIYDVIIMDFPDPNNASVGKLYSGPFFNLALKRLSNHGSLVTQATSPFFAKEAFWCIVKTVEQAKVLGRGALFTTPYHVNVPSFGEWGFVMATFEKPSVENLEIPVTTRFLNQEMLSGLFAFPKDIARIPTDRNELNSQHLVRYYSRSWKDWNY